MMSVISLHSCDIVTNSSSHFSVQKLAMLLKAMQSCDRMQATWLHGILLPDWLKGADVIDPVLIMSQAVPHRQDKPWRPKAKTEQVQSQRTDPRHDGKHHIMVMGQPTLTRWDKTRRLVSSHLGLSCWRGSHIKQATNGQWGNRNSSLGVCILNTSWSSHLEKLMTHSTEQHLFEACSQHPKIRFLAKPSVNSEHRG